MKFRITLAAVLCAVSLFTVMGCRSGNLNENDPAYDVKYVHKPLNTDEHERTQAPAPASPAAVDSSNPELVELRAEVERLKREVNVAQAGASNPAPVEQAAPPVQIEAAANGYTPSHGILPVPENFATSVLLAGMEIRSPLLRCEKVFGNTQTSRDDLFGFCSFRGKRVRTFHFNVPNGTTHRGGKVDVDKLGFIDSEPVRPCAFEVTGLKEKLRVIPLTQPGYPDEVWNWQFAVLPHGVRETMLHADPAYRIHWRVWVTFEDGTTSSIGPLSYTSESVSVDNGSGVLTGAVTNGRKPNGVMTHAIGMNPVLP